MGKRSQTSRDIAISVMEGQFTTTGVSAPFYAEDEFNIKLGAFTGTIGLEKTFDGGATWDKVAATSDGSALSWTSGGFTMQWFEPERGCAYRFNCSVLTTGTPAYRMSR